VVLAANTAIRQFQSSGRRAAILPGKLIVTANADSTARLWDAATGAERAVLTGHTGWVSSAAFSPDGKRVVTGRGQVGVIFGVGSHARQVCRTPDS